MTLTRLARNLRGVPAVSVIIALQALILLHQLLGTRHVYRPSQDKVPDVIMQELHALRAECRGMRSTVSTAARLNQMDDKVSPLQDLQPRANFDSLVAVPTFDKEVVRFGQHLDPWHPLDRKKFAIGIPTLLRDRSGTVYLLDTIESLLNNMLQQEQEETVLVVLLADEKTSRRQKVRRALEGRFPRLMATGWIHLIQAPASYYPEFKLEDEKFHDSSQRLRWRQKQCIDYSFLMAYSHGLADYYLQMEDDISTVPGWLQAVQQFVNEQQSHRWAVLEFSHVGFVGKLYPDAELPRVATFFWLFHQEQPVDFLLRYHLAILGFKKPKLRMPTLFEHKGVVSSLKGKTQSVQDQLLPQEGAKKQLHGDNPPATVESTMSAYGNHIPSNAYLRAPGQFWAQNPKEGATFTVRFNVPQDVQRVAVHTGNIAGEAGEHDRLEKGVLEVSFAGQGDAFSEQASFVRGNVQVELQYQRKIAAVRVRLTASQSSWLMIREVAVWT